MRAAALLIISAACAPEETAVLAWPTVQEAKSMLVIASLPGGGAIGAAAELDAEKIIELDLGDGVEELELLALVYEYPLRSLGLAPGRLEFGDGRPLPIAGGGIFRAQVTTAPGTIAWEKTETPPELLSRLRLASSLADACDHWMRFSQERVRIPGERPRDAISIAVPLDDGTAMFGTRSGRLFRAGADQLQEISGAGTSTEAYFGAIRGEDDIYLIRGGEFLRGDPARGFSVVAPFPGRATYYVWMTEDAAMTDSGEVLVFEGGAWRAAGAYSIQADPELSGTGAVVRTGPDEVAIASPIWWRCSDLLSCPTASNRSSLGYLRGGVLEDSAENFRPSAIYSDETRGTFVGLTTGELLMKRGDRFEPVGADPHQNIVWSIHPAPEGLFVAAGRGEIALYHPALGLCPPQSYALGPIRHIVPIQGGYLLAGEPDLVNVNGGDHFTVLRIE